MSDINFDCPNCGQNLDASEQMLGMTIFCPSCKQEIIVSMPPIAAPPPPPSGEDVEDDALKGSTVRIDLPPGLEFEPQPKRRIITIKRVD